MNQKDKDNCAGKDRYDSEQEAETAKRYLMQTTTSPPLFIYECPVCDGFHFTRTPQDDSGGA